MCIFAYIFYFIFCHLKKGSHMQIDNWPVIACSKYLFLNVFTLHNRDSPVQGSLQPCWTHSTRLRRPGCPVCAKGRPDNPTEFSPLQSKAAHALGYIQLTERGVERDHPI